MTTPLSVQAVRAYDAANQKLRQARALAMAMYGSDRQNSIRALSGELQDEICWLLSDSIEEGFTQFKLYAKLKEGQAAAARLPVNQPALSKPPATKRKARVASAG